MIMHMFYKLACETSFPHLPGTVAGLIKLFADDTKVYSTVENNQKQLALQNQVIRSETSATLWEMFFNILKCHHLHIGNLEPEVKYEITRDWEVTVSC